MTERRLYAILVGLVLLLTLAWFLALPPGAVRSGFWPARNALVNLSGILAIGCMSAGVILAARPVQIEDVLGGLDKFYRLHRWFGIAGATFAVMHWLFENGPRWLVGAGWLTRPQRPGAPAAAVTGFDAFLELREVAALAGEWGFYLMLVLVALALWRRFPYRWFFRAHRLLAAVYLALVFHSAIMMGRPYWAGPTGLLMLLLMGAGSVAAVMSLFRRIGKSRRAVGVIERLTHHQDNAVLDVSVRLETAWPGHHAGQFAFVDFGGVEGAHPFTISSSWHRDGRLAFSIKGLGDYTRVLPEQLFVGQAVTVEGPYGRFHFRGGREHQIWIGGGIGITPFIARLDALAERGSQGQVDLVYSTRAPASAFIDHIRSLAEQAGVRFHLLVEQEDGRLTLARLEERVPQCQEAEVWFCGPLAFGRAIREAMVGRGFPAQRFHQELFDMR
jgi:predicted ferric reductase